MGEAIEQSCAKAECCVHCGRETDYSRQTPIQDRIGYIEGAGQLCRDCHNEVYSKERGSDGENAVRVLPGAG